jgi:integrase
VYDVRVRDPEGVEQSRTFRTKRAAVVYEAEQLSAKARGGWVDPREAARVTLAMLSAEWLAANPAKRASSVEREGIALRRHVLPVLGDRPVASIKKADVQGLVNGLSGSMAPSTVQRTYSVLRAVMNFAVDRDLLLRSPCRDIRLPSTAPARRHIPSPVELARLAEVMPDGYGLMVWLGAVVGLRWGEVAGLRVGRLDFLRSTVSVVEQRTRGARGRMVDVSPKSAAGRRTFRVPAALMAMLTDHLAERGLTGADAEAFVFVSPDGEPLHYSNWLRRVWHPACVAAGLGKLVPVKGTDKVRYVGLGFHDLRRANATALVAEGVDLKTAQARLGHSNPRLTLGLYAQATEAADRAAADRLGTWFLGAPERPDDEDRGMDAG